MLSHLTQTFIQGGNTHMNDMWCPFWTFDFYMVEAFCPMFDVRSSSFGCFGCRYVLDLCRGECHTVLKFGTPRYCSSCVHEHVAKPGLLIIRDSSVIRVSVCFWSSRFLRFVGKHHSRSTTLPRKSARIHGSRERDLWGIEPGVMTIGVNTSSRL